MAWLLNSRSLARYLPRAETQPAAVELVSRQSAYGRAHPELFPKIGQWRQQGVWLPKDLLPDTARIVSAHKALPDYFSLAGLAFSNRLKEVVESLEPGVHQFKEVSVNLRSGVTAADRYYAVVLGHMASDQVVLEQSTIEPNTSPSLARIRPPEARDQKRICIDRSRSAGWHLWFAWDIYSRMIASNDLYSLMKREKITCFEYIELLER